MRVLLVDNYDSFTFNLFQLASEVFGPDIRVVPNDADWNAVVAAGFDAAIISPGPGHPARPKDFGISRNVIADAKVPVLGVCLGHQGIYHNAGGSVCHAPSPMHGRLSEVFHDGCGLFQDIPSPFNVVRYHSLMCAEPVPPAIRATAWTKDGVMMALEHRDQPVWGVQFHPESILTEHGRVLLTNFKHLAEQWHSSHGTQTGDTPNASAPPPATTPKRHKALSVKCTKLPLETDQLFETLFSHESYSFWLDSSLTGEGRARFSFMGGYSQETVTCFKFDAARQNLTEQTGQHVTQTHADLFDYLKSSIESVEVTTPPLPFDFAGGFLGYWGYELKSGLGSQTTRNSPHPDAYLLKVDRFLAIDHQTQELYVVVTTPIEDSAGFADARLAEEWWQSLEARLLKTPQPRVAAGKTGPFLVSQPQQQYVDSIHACLTALADGESYEVCLTNQLSAETTVDPFEYYKLLRRRNPAPYSAFFQFPELSVACSSPERFLKITAAGSVQTKPIKGTASRGATVAEDNLIRRNLAEDEKSRAENLMICDLLRNDLGRICEIGSVTVPCLMHVETYKTLHQLVTTITGQLTAGQTAVDCLRVAFPGGSMTGAPKHRTMEIIDSLEKVPRGVYSGAIGYLSWNGAADLNIVIRTAVFSGGRVTIGVGGAIIALSRALEEWEEILLKAQALLATFSEINGAPITLETVSAAELTSTHA